MAKKRISVQAAKSKGRILQKFVMHSFSEITGIKCGKDELIDSRGMGQSGNDVILIGEARKLLDVAVECKRTEKITPHPWIKQAKANLDGMSDWVVISRQSRQRAVAFLSMDYFKKLSGSLSYTVTASYNQKMWPILKWIQSARESVGSETWSIVASKPGDEKIVIIDYEFYISLLKYLVEKRRS